MRLDRVGHVRIEKAVEARKPRLEPNSPALCQEELDGGFTGPWVDQSLSHGGVNPIPTVRLHGSR